jgi:hypothetical protein
MRKKKNEFGVYVEFYQDDYLKSIYCDYLDGFSVREILWRLNIMGFNQQSEEEVNQIIDELNLYLL